MLEIAEEMGLVQLLQLANQLLSDGEVDSALTTKSI